MNAEPTTGEDDHMSDTPTPPHTSEENQKPVSEKPTSEIPDGSGTNTGSDDTDQDTASGGPAK